MGELDLAAAAAEGLEPNLRRWLSFRGISEGEFIELQAFDVPGNRYEPNRFAHASSIEEALRLLEEGERWRASGIYCIANRVDPAVAAREAPGRWHPLKKGTSTSDRDVRSRAVLYIDVDADRPTGISATDAEIDATHTVAARIHERLARIVGGDAIAIGHSGNGRSVFVALADLPVGTEEPTLVKEILACVRELFETPTVKVDQSVSDPKRLVPAFGTTKRKGVDAGERRHRRTAFLGPEEPRPVDAAGLAALLKSLRSDLTPEQAKRVDKALGRRSEEPPARRATAPRRGADEPWKAAKAIPIREVLGWLGLLDGDAPICCGCGLFGDSSVAIVGNGLKCSHARCADKGAPGQGGFRTTIDVVCEARSVEASEAVRLLSEHFGTPLPRGKKRGVEAQEPHGPGEKPVIRIVRGELPRMVEESIAALAEEDDNLYQRDGSLVFVAKEPKRPEDYEEDRRQGADIITRPGTPRIYRATIGVLTERLARSANWLNFDARRGKADENGKRSGVWVADDPDGRTVNIVCERRYWPGMRHLRGIIETPTLAPGGRVIDKPGYDSATGYLYLPSCTFPAIPDRPTQKDAREALSWLHFELFGDFPFAGGQDGPGSYVALTAILTLLSRPAIRGAIPGFAFEAAAQGSGKSRQMHVISALATGRPASVMTYPIGRDGRTDDAELEKILGGYALAGLPIVAFDNIKGEVCGGALEKVMTAVDSAALRVLGTNSVPDPIWTATMLFSGNNMTLSDDMAQRLLLSRIESPLEDPRSRPESDFRHPYLVPWVIQNRPGLVAAGLVVLRAFVLAGMPCDSKMILGSFEEWSHLVPQAIAFAGGPNVLLTRPQGADTENEEVAAHRTLLKHWAQLGEDGVKAADAILKAFPDNEAQQRQGTAPPDGFEDLRSAIRTLTGCHAGRKPEASKLGYALRSLRGKRRDGLHLVAKVGHLKTLVWSVVSG